MGKTKGQLQQLAVLNAISTSLATTLSTENLPVSNPVLPVSKQSSLANVNSPAKRGPPKDRSSPGSLTFKKRKTAASSSSLAEVAGVGDWRKMHLLPGRRNLILTSPLPRRPILLRGKKSYSWPRHLASAATGKR